MGGGGLLRRTSSTTGCPVSEAKSLFARYSGRMLLASARIALEQARAVL